MKTQIFFLLTLFYVIQTTAQNELPNTIKKAIPSKYKITYELFVKTDFIINASVSMEVPAKYACSDNLKGGCNITVTIISYDANKQDIIKNLEQMDPFANKLPTKESFKPEIDTWNELVKYSETHIVSMPAGQAAYYVSTHTCIQDQYDDFKSVNLFSLQGNTAQSIGIEINGAIDAEEAISIAKELYGIFSKFNMHSL